MSLPGSSGALRGAVDLSSLGRGPRPGAPGAAGAGIPSAGAGPATGGAGRPGIPAGLLVEVDESTFEAALATTREVAALAVIWDSQAAQTRGALDAAVEAAASYDGRLRVIGIDVRVAPRLAQAFQVQQIPVTLAIIAGQPLPLFAGVSTAADLMAVCDQVLAAAAQSGVTGRARFGPAPADDEGAEPELPPLYARAFAAIEAGDFEAAVAAYTQALKERPADADAAAGLAQVKLLQRTAGVDLAAARAAAAAAPEDIDAQLLVADLDLVGGHVEDAFSRCLDLVRATVEDDRERVRTRLLELFEVVGAGDERVVKARRSLMSALF